MKKNITITCASERHYKSMMKDFNATGWRKVSDGNSSSVWESSNERVTITY